jgi:DNA ligase D-like protein (predicted 3'-phosphoesterase)
MINNLVLESLNIKPRFIIHEHLAVKAGLHYDIRLEKNNKLKSWATRKLLDIINSNKKILLIQQPDHNMNWINYSGDIKEGYGKGEVKIWDKGTYTPIKWDDDSIVIIFNGEKIKSKYTIIKPSGFDDPKHYLMFKNKL